MRPHRNSVFLEMCSVIAKRSTCERAHVGAVIVRDRRVVSMGYNGAPPKLPQCDEVGCDLGDGGGCKRTIHAEANAIAWAARAGISTEGATMYCNYSPCKTCAELIVSAGIARFLYGEHYRAERLDILRMGGVFSGQIMEGGAILTRASDAPLAR